MALMRRLLIDAQVKFGKMVDDNKHLASRIDGELQSANQEVNFLRQELADTNRRITEIHHNQVNNSCPSEENKEIEQNSKDNVRNQNNSEITHGEKKAVECETQPVATELQQLRHENEKLSSKNRFLEKEVEELRRLRDSGSDTADENPRLTQISSELNDAKEALIALKMDRKRLKAEKFDLLNQMKQLYATFEDKEKELRDFIRSYEQRMKESDESLRQLVAEKDETERDKWNILKHARDEAERSVALSAQLALKDTTVRKLQDEVDMFRRQLSVYGYQSDLEPVRTNGLLTSTASTPTCSPLPMNTPTQTPNGRGSSADSGVRLSSDRDSMVSHEGRPVTPSKDSPSSVYATPLSLRDEPGVIAYRNPSTPLPNTKDGPHAPSVTPLVNSANGLSLSAEQLCERSEASLENTSKGKGSTSTLNRKSGKGGSTWGSISRVFARQKKRVALDASLYDGSASDKRASWSPSSSLCVSPLTEESYSEKLKLLEEAQRIPLVRWKAQTVLAWLEVTLGMPQYGAMCAENVRSGKVILELSDSELETGLGISNQMHRKKLRLAIEELRDPRLCRYPRMGLLDHSWVISEWLPDLGLSQYSESFASCLVDGRLLNSLSKKELEKYLGVQRKFHQASIIHGVHLLRIVRFDRQLLSERRRQSENMECDPLVWTNQRWMKWAKSIDLMEYAKNLQDSGVHGALVVLEPSFTADTMATALGIPQSKNIIRRHLATELDTLVQPAKRQTEEHARYLKLQRRRQDRLSSGGSLGRSFCRSYGTLDKGETREKRRSSLRGSLSRALGIKFKEELSTTIESDSNLERQSSFSQSVKGISAQSCQGRPRSSIVSSGTLPREETSHRRVRSISELEKFTVTPV